MPKRHNERRTRGTFEYHGKGAPGQDALPGPKQPLVSVDYFYVEGSTGDRLSARNWA